MGEASDDLRSIIKVDRLIHEPARLIVTAILYGVESADYLYLQRETGLTKGNLTSHLSKLERAKYIEIEKTYNGKIPRTVCRITKQGRAAFDDYRERLKRTVDSLPE